MKRQNPFVPNIVSQAVGAAVVLIGSSTGPAAAQETGLHGRPEVLEALLVCRETADPVARLACFDRAASVLDAAERGGDLVVVDRAQVVEARRQMFGIDLPTLPRLLAHGEASEPLDAIETTLMSASGSEGGYWTFHLADGSRWRNITATSTRISDRTGQPVRIRRAAMGSYLMTVGASTAMRARRITP